MAKILDNLFSTSTKKLVKLRRNYQWMKTELEALPEQILAKERQWMQFYGSRINRKLAKPAFEACDKQDYADFILSEKLKAFDIRQYRKYRAINHGCLKSIFRAIEKGLSWDEALRKQEKQLAGLRASREAYLRTLEAEKRKFLAKYTTSNAVEYEQRSARLSVELAQRQQKLDMRYGNQLARRTDKLSRKMERCARRISALEARIGHAARLPEDVLLRVEGLKMYFGGLKAVDDLTFDVKKGEIFGLIGPNGAGKTTVFNCITRFYDATGGQMYFVNKDGLTVDLRKFAVHDVILQGISRTFQNVELVKEVSVLDNLLIASTREYRSGILTHALGLPSLRKEERLLREKAMRVLKFMGLENYAGWLAMGLPYGVLKKVEIARALMSDTKLIIMDEPAAGLNDSETAELTQLIRRIRDEFHVTILLVEHDMGLVMNVCDTVCAISFGKMLAIGTCEQIKQNKAVQEAYLGVEEDA